MLAIANKWIEDLSPGRTGKGRLFCFPYAGGGAALYRAWPALLPASLSVAAIKLPGRETRIGESAPDNLEALVEPIVAALLHEAGERSYFFGHSFGALLAFETARRLTQAHGRAPHVLFASGCRAPQCPPPEPIHHRPRAEFLEGVRAMNGTPDAIFENAEMVELILPALRADFAAYETYGYLPAPPLPLPIVVLGGLDDDIPMPELRGWEEHTAAEFEMHFYPGNHFFIADSRAQVLRTVAGVFAGL